MEQISNPLECNVVGVQGVEICCPANAIGISKFIEYANSILPETGRCGWESKEETVVAVFLSQSPDLV